MATDTTPQAVQLDAAERSELETVVTDMRDRVEANVRYQLEELQLTTEPTDEDLEAPRQAIYEAISLEGAADTDWTAAVEAHIDGVGYTIVNRLAALRCMEVRGFIDREVTVFREDGLTPAAAHLVETDFLMEDEALMEAYDQQCRELEADIEILFDSDSPYSLIDPDRDTFQTLCELLDRLDDRVWAADDVLGWVYEYYNRPVVEALDAKNTLEPADVGPANQFYTPHWVVRMLTDNSLGKLYLEATDQTDTVPPAEALSPDERKDRPVTPDGATSVPELCTYLIPDEDSHEAPDFEHPSELRVIDPACGSGHFLLYAFDVLERIWWAETDVDRGAIPGKILEHNLYGVDIDLRSCQLSAFNLYLKARERAAAEGNDEFAMPNVGIVCADASVAEVEAADDVLDEITGADTDIRAALDEVIDEFQATEALGSLLDVQGALADVFDDGQTGAMEWTNEGPHTLHGFLSELEDAVEANTADSFGEQNLRSFLQLLEVLTQEYDVALMNPPYGSRGRMPDAVQDYVDENYKYTTEYYINFFEACDRLATTKGRIGMLVPWSFMFNKSFQAFREDFVGERGAFDFFAEFGYDILDNATVGTVGTVVRSGEEGNEEGSFIRLPDIDKGNKESVFIGSAFCENESNIKRFYQRELSEFNLVPGTPLSYWVPKKLRSLYQSDVVLDADNGRLDRESFGNAKVGLQTGDDGRFTRKFWETSSSGWYPFAKGGADSWILPRVKLTVYWSNDGKEIKRYYGSRPQNTKFYQQESLSYTMSKRSGKRFGYLHDSSLFGHMGPVYIPSENIWNVLSYTNSHLFTYLMLMQTSERNWEIGLLSKVPWEASLEESSELEKLSLSAVENLITLRSYDFVSPHYSGPILLSVLETNSILPMYDHPHRELHDSLEVQEPQITVGSEKSLNEIGIGAAKHRESLEKRLQDTSEAIDEAVFDCFDITQEQQEEILQEIALRTIEDPRENPDYDPESITEPPEDFPEMVKDLLLHLTLKIVHEDDDGIVPLSNLDTESDLLTRLEAKCQDIFGEHTADRLAEIDGLLGDQPADEEAYPNLRTWLEEELFEYHLNTFDKTPILWRLTSERLVSDPTGEGFACLLDYHQLDDQLFDTLQTRYLEPRKAQLREQQQAADRRRNDDSLAATAQSEAAETYVRCESGLEQIDAFEDELAALAEPTPREWPADLQDQAAEAVDKVALFKELTESKLEALDAYAALEDVDMADQFSPTFYEKVNDNRKEWLDALDTLQTAFEAYARPGEEPVEAHLYDLFEYIDDIAGSTHFAANGILFMTYYFDDFTDIEQAQLGNEGLTDHQELLSTMGDDLEGFINLAEDIQDSCDTLADNLSSEWADRALSEITTAGYQPNHKHGVVINITPLVEAEIVPESVDNDVV